MYIESAKTVNEITLNELVKLTTFWTTGPWYYVFVRALHGSISGLAASVWGDCHEPSSLYHLNDLIWFKHFWVIVYNRTVVYKRQNCLKVVVHVIIIDQWNQTARSYEILVTAIFAALFLSLWRRSAV